jgi:hypothetical protein
MFYISKTKAAFNPANTNTPDTFVSRGYDTREEAAEALEVIEAINTMLAEKSNLCIIEHDQNKIGAQHPNNCKNKKLSQTKKTKFIMTTFNIGDAVTFKPNIDSPEKDCIKGIVAEVLENGYYNVTVGLTSFWGSREVKLYGANLYSRV